MKKFKPLISLLFVLLSVNTTRAFDTSIRKDTTIYENLKDHPNFPGGVKAFGEFIQRNLKWPDPQIDTQGRVLVSFIVEKNGSLTNFKIQKGLQDKFDAEALRVIKISPKWISAKLNGKPVRSKYIVPINFTLSE